MSILYKGQEATASYIEVAINWPAAGTRLLKAGTPIDADGKVANGVKAIGLLANDVGYSVFGTNARLIVSGMVDLSAAQASYGSSYQTIAKEALDQITFIKSNGQVDHQTYAKSSDLDAYAKKIDLDDYTKTEDLPAVEYAALILKSSTEASEKKFLVTVNDSGTLTATEIVPPAPEAGEG